MNVRLAAAAALALALVSSRAEASPEDLFGFGARTSALGATGVAHATGYETAWHNPALASTIRQNKLTLGYGGAVFALDVVGAGLPGRVGTRAANGFLIGGDVPIPFGGALRDRVGIAIGFQTPSDVVLRGRVLYPEKTQLPLLGDRAQSLTVRAGVGADIGYGVRLGIGIAALAEIEGKVVAATDVTGRVGAQVENELVATYAPTFGATYDVPGSSKVRIGAVYRGELDARFAIMVDGSRLSSLTIPRFNIAGIAQYDPAQAALEVARVDALNVLAAQVVYKRWSDFPGVLEPTVICEEGGPGACGLVPPRIAWRDTVAVRIGAEQGWELAPGLVVRTRGGGFVETSALPSEVPASEAFDVASGTGVRVPTRYFDATRVALTTGLGVALGAPRAVPIEIDTFVQVHVLVPRTVTSGDAAGELSRGEVSGRIKVFGLTAGVRF